MLESASRVEGKLQEETEVFLRERSVQGEGGRDRAALPTSQTRKKASTARATYSLRNKS